MNQLNSFRPKTGMQVSLLGQWSGSEDTNITSFSKILLKFVIVLKFLNNFVILLISTIITNQRNFLSPANELGNRTPETKNNFLHCEIWKHFL